MKVKFGSSLWLAPGGNEGTTGASWNGNQLNEEVEYAFAEQVAYFSRGERATVFAFGVNRSFDTEADALEFAATHFADIPEQDDLRVYDEAESVIMLLSDAVLDGISVGQVVGLSVFVQYVFRGGLFTVETPP